MTKLEMQKRIAELEAANARLEATNTQLLETVLHMATALAKSTPVVAPWVYVPPAPHVPDPFIGDPIVVPFWGAGQRPLGPLNPSITTCCATVLPGQNTTINAGANTAGCAAPVFPVGNGNAAPQTFGLLTISPGSH